MANDPCKALLIEDDLSYARILQKRLSQEAAPAFHVEWSDKLQSGLEQFAKEGADVVLLDLHLPDSQGLDTLIKARLDEHLARHNAQAARRYPLSFSVGMVYVGHEASLSIEGCLSQADAALYEHKRRKKPHV